MTVNPTRAAVRAMFASASLGSMMFRGPQVAYAPDEELAPAAEAPAPVENAAPAEGDAESAAAPEVQGEPPEGQEEPPAAQPAKKSPVAQLQGRVGHLTKSLHERDSELATANAQIETYKALLAAQGKTTESAPAEPVPSRSASPANPAPGTPEFQALVRQEAQRLAQQSSFDAECNKIYETGKTTHAETWDESVSALNAMGYMTPQLVEAAIASGDGAKVLNALGQDLDEAARIAALPPIRMAAELTKMASASAKPATAAPASRAPAPIRQVNGTAPAAEPDLAAAASGGDMAAYVAARKAQGSRWAR